MPRVPPPLARPCKDWCAKNGESWEQKCTYGNSCAGCDACNWAKQRRRNAVKKRKEEKRGEKRAAKEQAKPKRPGGAVVFREGQQEDRKARDRKTVQKRAKGRGRGRREPLPPLQGLAQGLNPNRGG